MLIWCLKQVKDFILKFPVMEVSVEVQKIIKCTIYSTVFFTSDGDVDVVLVRLLLIKQIIKNVNLMSISFCVKHPQTFRES